MIWSRQPAWPGTEVWFQPGGLEGPNVVTQEADLQALIDATFTGLYGGGKLVIDGQYNSGAVQLTTQLDLKSSFDVRFTNVQAVDVAFADSGGALFLDPKQSIDSDMQVVFTRSVQTANQLFRARAENLSRQFWCRNCVWNPAASFGGVLAAAFARVDNGATQFWFEDCAFQPDLTAATRAADRWLAFLTTAPTSLQLAWYGPNAGVATGTASSQFLVTALSGWNTEVRYGTFGGALMNLTGIAWSAAAPTVVSRQP